MVYMTTPNGRRKQAAGVGIPVSEDTTAEPPVNNIAVTRMFVIKPKTVKTRCASAPYRALMTSRKVYGLSVLYNGFRKPRRLTCALGALLFNSIAIVANNKICTVAPLAYQNGPETPYRYAIPDDCRRVAAQVHEDTTAEATRPDFTVLPAVLNISEV